MKFTGERFVPSLSGEIACEHLNRYYFVVNQLTSHDKVILDIACGEGYGTNILSKYAKHIYGVDISEEAIEHAKNKYQRRNLTFKKGDATAIPLRSNSIDIVVSFETIEHLAEHQGMINEIKRVLRTDGVLIISSPDKLHYSENTGYSNSFHIKELYSEEFKLLIRKNFNNAKFFSQNLFVGSIISLDDSHVNYIKPIYTSKKGVSTSLNPKYNIAIATDSESIEINYPTVNYLENDKFLSIQEELNLANYEGQLKVTNSLAYRIGNMIIKPIKVIQKITNNIWQKITLR